jgi:tRNA(His) 5'-end guanylyltransferase
MKKNKDSLGDRMKAYEQCYRLFIPKKTYVAIRLDGKSFHSYTKGLDRPFDKGLMDDMDATTKYLCENIPNCKVGYVQSDEISLVLCDDASNETEPWFGNNLQKICSVSCSMATAKFNQLRLLRAMVTEGNDFRIEPLSEVGAMKLANFDSRVFILPNASEVLNMLHWRSQDATRNSISSVAQSLYSHKELHGVNSKQQQELIFQKGINWNDYSYREKRGGTFAKVIELEVDEELNRRGAAQCPVVRAHWKPVETPINWFDEREKVGL